jgi:hypothetical protein
MGRLGLFALLAALALSMTACGGAGVSAPDLSGVAQAAEKTQNAGTARFEVSLSASGLTGQTGSATLTAKGAVDYANQRSQMTVDLGSLGSLLGGVAPAAADTTLDVVLDGKVLYVRFPLLAQVVAKGKDWLKLDLEKVASAHGADLGQLGQLAQGDPAQALGYLRAAGDFTAVGQETVRGVETTHYKGAIDLAKAADNLSGPQNDEIEKLLQSADVHQLPAEAWIDGDGYLRKLTLSFSQLSSAPDEALDLTMELYDLGSTLEINPPPSGDVTDISDLAGKGGLGS